MRKMTEQTDDKLKEFMLSHFDFDPLKKAGVYGKEIKRKDYQAQADRICSRLGLKSIYDYPEITITTHGNWGSVVVADVVTQEGEFIPGMVGHLSLATPRKSREPP